MARGGFRRFTSYIKLKGGPKTGRKGREGGGKLECPELQLRNVRPGKADHKRHTGRGNRKSPNRHVLKKVRIRKNGQALLRPRTDCLKRKAFPKKERRAWEKPEGIQTGLIPGMSAGLRVRGGPKGPKPPLRPSLLPSEPQNAPDFDPPLCAGSRQPCGNTPQVGEGPSNLHESSSPWQGPCRGRRSTLIL